MAREVDANAYNYGGNPDEAKRQADTARAQAMAAQNRQGEQINTANADQSRNSGNDARGAQLRMADMMYRRASGQTPSIAQAVGDRQMGQAAAEQSSAAASARGPAALALSQQGAAANTAAVQSNISNQTQINAAQERMQAEQAANGAYAGLRAGDQSQQGLDAHSAQAQAAMNAQQRAQNDQFGMANKTLGTQIDGMQMGGQMARDAQQQAHDFNTEALEMQKERDDDAETMGWVGAGVAAAGTVASFASDERAKVPARWSPKSRGVAPAGMGYGESNEDVRSGYDTNSVTMAKMVARQSLDEQDRSSAQQASQDATSADGIASGPMAFSGVEALKRRDSEDLGLIQAKQRNGVELSAKEEASKASLQHRAGQDKLAGAGKPKAEGKEEPDRFAQVGGGVAGLGKSISDMGNARRGGETYRYTPAAPVAMPSLPQSAQMTSDGRAKTKAKTEKPSGYEGFEARALGTADDSTIQWDQDRGGKLGTSRVVDPGAQEEQAAQGASLSGPTPKFSMAKAVAAKPEAAKQKTRKMTDAELDKLAKEMLGSVNAQKDAQLAAGPSVGRALERGSNEDLTSGPSKWDVEWNRSRGNASGSGMSDEQDDNNNPQPYDDENTLAMLSDERTKSVGKLGNEVPREDMAEAARSMRSVPYAYKPGFAEREGQGRGEVNVGPVAQEMERSPVAATAVRQEGGPDGVRSIDMGKFTKVLGGVAASQQKQLDEQERKIESLMARRIGGRR